MVVKHQCITQTDRHDGLHGELLTWVSQVVSEVLDGALAGHDGLDIEAEHGEHGQAAVLDLLHLELSERIGVVSQVEGVEGAAGVQGVEALNARGRASGAERLSLGHDDDLEGQGGDDALGMHQVGVSCEACEKGSMGQENAAALKTEGGHDRVCRQLRAKLWLFIHA